MVFRVGKQKTFRPMWRASTSLPRVEKIERTNTDTVGINNQIAKRTDSPIARNIEKNRWNWQWK